MSIYEQILSAQSESEIRSLIKGNIDNINGITLYNKRKCNDILKKIDLDGLGAKFAEKLYNFVYENSEIKTCEVCNKNKVKWQGNLKKGYYLTCSAKCFPKHPQYQSNYKSAILKTYGVDNVSKCKAVYDKIKKTNLDRYGVENMLQTSKSKEALKKKNIAQYGVENKFKSAQFHIDSKKTFNARSWQARLPHILTYAKPLFEHDTFSSVEQILDWECVKCNKRFKDTIRYGYPRCPSCERLNGRSKLEQELFDFVSTLEKDATASKYVLRDGDARRQVDVWVPSKNVAIEFNGIYWHSVNAGTCKSYHLDKARMAKQQNIRLIHVFEDDWISKKEIVKSRLISVLGHAHKLHARKCLVKQISSQESAAFLNDAHLQGAANAKIHLGLFHDDQLVACMTFSNPRFSKKHDWEIVRFANKLSTNVVGGASKLFCYFNKNFMLSGQSILSYSDKCWGDGNVYRTLGFSYSHSTSPAVWYAEKKNLIRQSRIKFQKHKLKELLPNFDPAMSELDNMIFSGYLAIFDCGNDAFVYTKT